MSCCGKGPFDDQLDTINNRLDRLAGYTVTMDEIDALRELAAKLLEKRNKTPLLRIRIAYQKSYDKLLPEIEEKLRIYRQEHNI